MGATKQQLDDAIASLPQRLEDALVPVVAAILDKGRRMGVDFQPEIDSLAEAVAKVATDLTPSQEAPPQ